MMSKNLLETSTAIEWSSLLSGLIILGFSLILGAIIIISTQQYYNYVKDWNNQQNRILKQVKFESEKLQQALDIVNQDYLTTFNQLKKEGFFLLDTPLTVEEQRLKMHQEINTFFSRSDEKLFPGGEYTLSELKPYIPMSEPEQPIFRTEPAFKTYENSLILKLGLLHEEDVLDLIKGIEFQSFVGLFNLQSCDIRRLPRHIDVKDISKPYFQANCVLVWYTSRIEKEVW